MAPVALDDRGVPRLVRAVQVPAAPAATVTESALKHLGRLSAAWGVRDTALPALQPVGEIAGTSGTVARVKQTIDGVPIHRGELRVLVKDNGELVAANGVLVGADTPRAAATWKGNDADAVARAVAHNYKTPFQSIALGQHQVRADGSRMVRGRDGEIDVQLARATKAWQHTGAMLVPVWVVEAYASRGDTTNGDAFATVMSVDGRVISHRSLTADVAFTYRVFAEPTGEFHPFDGPIADFSPHPTGIPDGSFPAFADPNLVTVDGMNHPAGNPTVPDPWLLAARTETLGNNVDAYVDVTAPTGLTFGDFRATTTGTRTFDRSYRTSLAPLSSQSQQMASITSLFFGINWQHDFWYDAGFTEVAGNGQENNFNRGGEDRDAILAEAQDNAIGAGGAPGSLNNANMSTPADGFPPRMQVFIWSPAVNVRTLTLQPSNRNVPTNYAQFGPFNFDVNAQVVLANDGVGVATDACTALPNTVAGRIVLADRGGGCTFKQKALNVQQAGGVAIIIANDVATGGAIRLPEDLATTAGITIGALSISLAEGNALKAELAAGAVTALARRVSGAEADGGLDSTLVAHEFGHYLHHRLQDCTTTFCSAISEGWGDFNALISMAREGDNLDGAFPFSIYTTRAFTSDSAYFGIRRAPYSVNPAINALSYRHMSDGVALPDTHPILIFGNNAEVHNAGEIWTAAMWEVYVALQKAGTSFTDVRAKMARYVVQGLLMAPVDATPTETRDAIVAVAAEEDRPIMLAAFARRGMGTCAVTPDRNSGNFVGIVGSDRVAGNATTGGFAIDDSVKSCDEKDGILDNGETGKLTFPVSNNGHAELASVKVTVTPGTTGLAVASAPVEFATIAAGETKDVVVELKLDGAGTAPLGGALTVKVESQNGCVDTFDVPVETRLNLDDIASNATADAFDAVSVWKPTASPTPVWVQQRTPTVLEGRWHAADLGGISDTSLESPDLVVGTDPLVVTFKHRFSFEFSANTAWDGGVIEYSEDNGATWQDVTTAGANPGYNFTLGGAGAGNPLLGRQGYGGANAGGQTFDTVTLEFGTRFSGKTIKLRFRLGTDEVEGGPGWDIDDLSVQGITNKPFPTQAPNRKTCSTGPGPGPDPDPDPPGPPLPPDEEPGCCGASPLRGSHLGLAFGVLALLFRRRRRA